VSVSSSDAFNLEAVTSSEKVSLIYQATQHHIQARLNIHYNKDDVKNDVYLIPVIQHRILKKITQLLFQQNVLVFYY
jgi:hypothetical protein